MEEEKIRSIAETNFKISLKPEQLDAIQSYANGSHTLLIAPTSFGKSIVYQVAPFLYDQDRYHISSTTTTSTTNKDADTARQSTPDIQWSSSEDGEDITGSSNTDSFGSLAQEAAPDTSTPLRPDDTTAAIVGEAQPTSTEPYSDDVTNLSENMSGLNISRIQPERETPTISSSAKIRVIAQFLVIVPLVALINDAVMKVRQLTPQVSAVHLTAATLHLAKSAVLIFTSPESIIDGTGRRLIQCGLNIRAVFVDEFHIIERWGYGTGSDDAFRTAYGRLGELRALLPDVPFIGLSATATDDTVSIVTSSLKLNQPRIIKVSINKPNITYHTVGVTGSVIKDFEWLITMIRNSAAASLPKILIFFNNVNTLINTYETVTSSINQPVGAPFPTVVMYHLITDERIKERIIRDLGQMNGLIKCVFCTRSLSMGMNLANIAYVLHYGVSTTADTFMQETGRAAREITTHGHSILLHFPRMAAGRKLDETMTAYKKAATCLRQILLSKFSCLKPKDQEDCCDVCEPSLSCAVKSAILESYDSSIAESFSDSLSIGSVGDLDEI